ncbi:MAG: DNA polymerase IV [Burkholderiaceae bacterium]|nr:DNA polymerase IV [Burkholderiaceae bacterium]
MDAFYASVELLRYPELRGQAVVVGGSTAPPERLADGTHRFARLRSYVGRGVVTTSSYEARALGVFSAMGLMKAAQLAPDAVLLPADFKAYRHYSNVFKAAVASIAPHIENRGVDEIYIDLTALDEDTRPLASRIKAAVRAATGLSCSIGVAPNKLLAKIASELDKPDGLTVLAPHDVARRVWPLPVRKINGIGPKASERLNALGIESVADLAHAPPDLLQTHFGLHYAQWLLQAAHGHDDRKVERHSEPKSISRETTFDRDLHARHDRRELGDIFTSLCALLAADLDRMGYAGRTVGIKLRYSDFQIVTRDISLPEPVMDNAAIRRAAAECIRRAPLDKRLRLMGVRVSALTPAADVAAAVAPRQGKLFD